MEKLIEIAKANGLHFYGGDETDMEFAPNEIIVMTPDQLRATVEQVCAPLVESLSELKSLCWRQKDFNDDGDGLTLHRSEKALAAYVALVGDEISRVRHGVINEE